MLNGQGWHRDFPYVVRGIAILTILSSGGCNRLPLRQVEATPTARPTTRVETSTPPAELPPLPVTPLAEPLSETPRTPDQLEIVPGDEPNRETPLLDAALARASEARVIEPSSKPIELPLITAPQRKPAPSSDVPRIAMESELEIPPKSTPLTVAEPTPIEPLPEQTSAPANLPAASKSKPIDPEKSATIKPRDFWLDGLGDLRAFAARHSGEPGERSETWVVRSRVLDWLSAEPNTSPADTAWTSVLSAIVAATGPEPVDPPVLAPKILEAIANLESLSPLAIVDLKLCRKVQGFGHREPLEPTTIKASQPLLVYCEISGLRYEPMSEGFQSRLTSRAEIMRTGGNDPVWAQELGLAEDVCRIPRRDYFINYRIPLPSTLSPGEYQLRVTQSDVVSGRDATATVAFRVIP